MTSARSFSSALLRFAVVASRFNADVTDRLLESCLRTLRGAGVPNGNISVTRVPGAYEIPWAAQEAALTGKFDAVVCLGAVLRGQTTQNDHIAASTISHIQRVALKTRVPCILGVLTPATHAQAMARTRGTLDRGREAALAALRMAQLRRDWPAPRRKARR